MLGWNSGGAFVLTPPISSCFPAGLTHMIWTGLNNFALLHNKLSSLIRCTGGQQAPSHVTLICFFSFVVHCVADWQHGLLSSVQFAGMFWARQKENMHLFDDELWGEEVVVAFCDELSPRVRRVLLSQWRCVELSRVYLFARSWCLKTEDVQFAEGILRQMMVVLGASLPACWYGTHSLCQGTLSWRAWCLLSCSFSTHCWLRTVGSTGAFVIFPLTSKSVFKYYKIFSTVNLDDLCSLKIDYSSNKGKIN